MKKSKRKPKIKTRSRDAITTHISNKSLGAKVAAACGVTRQAVSLWCEVPPHHVLTVAKVIRIPRTKIRPDLYPPRARGGEAVPIT